MSRRNSCYFRSRATDDDVFEVVKESVNIDFDYRQ